MLAGSRSLSTTKATYAVVTMAAVETEVTRDLSPYQAAQQTGFSRTLIYREIERGHLRAYRVGGRLRITAEALAEWKRHHAVVPRPHIPSYEPMLGAREVRQSDSFASELRAIRTETTA